MLTYKWKYAQPTTMVDATWEQEVFRTIYTTCLKVKNDLMVNKVVGGAWELQCSPAVVAALECLDEFMVDCSHTEIDADLPEVTFVGTLSEFKVYRDFYSTRDYVVVRNGINEAIIEVEGLDNSCLGGN